MTTADEMTTPWPSNSRERDVEAITDALFSKASDETRPLVEVLSLIAREIAALYDLLEEKR